MLVTCTWIRLNIEVRLDILVRTPTPSMPCVQPSMPRPENRSNYIVKMRVIPTVLIPR